MNEHTTYVGIDIAKSELELEVSQSSRRCPNTPPAIAQALRELPAGVHLVCEATGGYETALLEAALAAGVPISLVAPERVRAHARSLGRLAKTDRLDAALLSAYGRAQQPAPFQPASPARLRLRALVRAREYLVELQTRECNWTEHLPASHELQAQAEARAQLLATQLSAVEHQIRELVRTHAPAREQVARLRQLCGVGEVTAWTVWADLPELGQLQPGQAAALAGLAPYARDSGQHHGVRHIHHGRATLRRVLYMAALAASAHNPVLKLVYQRLRANGKPAKLALVAIARRLVETMNLLLKNPNFVLAS